VALPYTLFDSKLSTAAHPLFWDDAETSGSGTSSTFSQNKASYTLAVSDSIAGKRVRQTRQRFNYQPGKSQLVALTCVMGAKATGITRRVGYFDGNNGLFFEVADSTMKVVVRSNVSGTPTDTAITQKNFDFDTIDGKGPSGVKVDTSKALIFVIDFESLQVGTVRFGMYFDGVLVYSHAAHHANLISSAYFSTPNLPVRYEISNDGAGPAATLEVICSTVISEGGSEETGITRYLSTSGTHVDADAADTTYAVVGIRLKSTALDSVVKLAQIAMFCETNDDFEWLVILNPTVAGTFTYNDVSNSALQYATGATANTITGGTVLAGGWSASASAVSSLVNSLYYLGSTIDGTSDEIVLAVRPLATQADIQGSVTVKEIA